MQTPSIICATVNGFFGNCIGVCTAGVCATGVCTAGACVTAGTMASPAAGAFRWLPHFSQNLERLDSKSHSSGNTRGPPRGRYFGPRIYAGVVPPSSAKAAANRPCPGKLEIRKGQRVSALFHAVSNCCRICLCFGSLASLLPAPSRDQKASEGSICYVPGPPEIPLPLLAAWPSRSNAAPSDSRTG